MIDLGSVAMRLATEPETYWQSPHYRGYPAVPIRYDGADPERVRGAIAPASEQAQGLPPKRGRRRA